MSKPLSEETIALVRARELLTTKGWTQGAYRNQYGHCLVGALANAVHMPSKAKSIPICDLVRPFCDGAHPLLNSHDAITNWNDADDRTLEEVLEVLDKAIQASISR